MTQTHEALKLAGALEILSSSDNKSLTRMWAREADPKTAAILRRQHALIVQMAAALEKMEKATQTTAVHFQADASQQCSATLTAAKEYLK